MVLGYIISAITFPGVILHEYAHEKMCRFVGVDVYEVVYLRIGSPMGFVRHGEVDSFKQSFSITVAPFLINSIAALLFFTALFSYGEITGILENPDQASVLQEIIFLVPFWLGFSSGIHALPSSQDAKNLWNFSRDSNNLSAKIGLPISAFIYLTDKLRFFWIDAIYALTLLGITAAILNPLF